MPDSRLAPRRPSAAAFGALLAASFATKESTFITIFVAGSFFLVAILVQAWRGGGWRARVAREQGQLPQHAPALVEPRGVLRRLKLSLNRLNSFLAWGSCQRGSLRHHGESNG